MVDAVEVHITYPDAETAQAAAAALVDARLIACGQVSAVTSVYRWNDEIEREPEWLLTGKTLASALPVVADKVRETHPYDVPQITALPIVWGAQDYLDWITDNVDA